MLVSSNTFDNSTFFYEQLKFTWVVWVVIGVKVGGEIDPPSGDPITVDHTLKLTFPRPSKMTASGLDISRSFSNRDARNCGKLSDNALLFGIENSRPVFKGQGAIAFHPVLCDCIQRKGGQVPLWWTFSPPRLYLAHGIALRQATQCACRFRAS